MGKRELLAATAMSLLLVAAPVHAQTTDTDTARQDRSDDQQGYTNANEIVVTATRRNQTVQDIPVAVTAVDSQLLQDAGVQDIRGLEQLAPSLQTTTGQSAATGASISIRGVGTAGDNPGFEPAVGVFIDGVFRARAGVALSELPELERVEVLRGPQGTLFGRNTSAGAISIFTAKPKFKPEAYVEASYGNYDAYEVKGALTGPVTDTLALRVDAGRRKRDGYIHDANSDRTINNIDRYYVRGQALYDTAKLSFRLIGDYSHTDEACCGAVNVFSPPGIAQIINADAAQRGLVGVYTGDPKNRIQAISPGRSYGEQVQDWGVSGELNYDLGSTKLTSITAYRNWSALRDQDIDFSGVDRAYRDGYRTSLKDFTQEVRLQGSAFGGVLDWLVGGFYLNETLKLRDVVRVGEDVNLYTDSLFALNPSAGFQFYGSYNVPSFPQLVGAYTGGPALPTGTVPLLGQLLYLNSPQLQAAAPPGSPLFNYLNTPLAGNAPGQGNNDDNFRVRTNAFALFTHNIVNVTDKLSLTLGLRYNYEKKKLNASINNNTGGCGFFTSTNPLAATYRAAIQQAVGQATYNNFYLVSCNPAVNTEFNGNYNDSRSDSKLTGTAKIAYAFTPHVLAYASYDRGFKSGGYNLDQATFDSVLLGGNGAQGSDLAFGDETVDSYEIGLKTSIARGFTFNIAAFYANYSDLQSLVFSGTNFVVQNIDKSTSKGIEIESIIQPVRELSIRLGYTYLDAGYDKSNDFTGTPLQGLEGRQFQNQPKNVVTLATTWQPELTDTIKGLVHVDMRYNSEVNIAGLNPVTGRGFVYNEGYPLIAARLGLHSMDDKYQLEFFVENLTNQYYNITGFAVPEQTGRYAGYPGTPRFYGAKVRVGF